MEKTLMSHDVFISFRGDDTRRGFVSHLQDALRRNKIRTYKDDCDLERGNEISPTLLRAIERSKISLIVFSENYASSRWTLDELVTIMNCRRTRRQLVLPIFYRISPSEVRKKRSYSAVFKKHKNLSRSCMKETEQRWTKAITEAADLAGWESSTYRTESELVELIASEVKKQLKSMSHGVLNFLGHLGNLFLRKEQAERLILITQRPCQRSSLDTYGYCIGTLL